MIWKTAIAVLFTLSSAATSATARTNVSGTITSSLWTLDGSPYFVTDSVTVPSGEVLTVEPGVQVRFSKSARLYIEGAILANGTEDDSVLFVSDSRAGWGGLWISGGETSILTYVRITGGTNEWRPWILEERLNGGALRITGNGTHVTLENSVISRSEAQRGGGLYADSATVTLVDCTVRDNFSSNRGGGISVGACPSLRLVRCLVIGNRTHDRGGGLYPFSRSVVRADSCTFIGNRSGDDGAGAYIDSSLATFRQCVWTGNRAGDAGGAISVRNDARGEFYDCLMYDNHSGMAHAGGLCIWTSEVYAKRCLIWGNSSEGQGAGICAQHHSTVELDQCTIARNWIHTGDLDYHYGGLFSWFDCDLTVTNSIIWGNSSNQAGAWHRSKLSISYSHVGGDTVWAGQGNIIDDPLFVDPDGGDYRLTASSPCIDTGDPSAPLDPDGTRADMGGVPHHSPLVMTPGGPSPALQLRPNYPNPFNPSTTIEYDLDQNAVVLVIVFNAMGQRIRTLVDEIQEPGQHSVLWDGTDSDGRRVASGLYSYIVARDAGEGCAKLARRMILLR